MDVKDSSSINRVRLTYIDVRYRYFCVNEENDNQLLKTAILGYGKRVLLLMVSERLSSIPIALATYL